MVFICGVRNHLSSLPNRFHIKKISMASSEKQKQVEENPPKKSEWSWFTSFEYNKEHDKPGDARNVLLVVAALITAVTFQAGVNPPGGVWQDNDNGHTAGRAIYGTHKGPFYVFLISNTLALSSSIFVIVLLTHRFPFHFEVMIATLSMIVTYGSAVFAVTPNESVKFRYILFTAALPYVLRFFYQLCRRYYKHCVHRLRSYQNPCSGCA